MSNISEAMAMLEAEAEAIMEIVGRREGTSQDLPPAPDPAPIDAQRQESTDTAEGSANEDAPAQPEDGATSGETSQQNSLTDSRDTPMDVDTPGPSGTADKAPEKKPEAPGLPRLSEQLLLEELWDTLGECLTELARTSDHHAVLVLQPAVEAFFLVHAGK